MHISSKKTINSFEINGQVYNSFEEIPDQYKQLYVNNKLQEVFKENDIHHSKIVYLVPKAFKFFEVGVTLFSSISSLLVIRNISLGLNLLNLSIFTTTAIGILTGNIGYYFGKRHYENQLKRVKHTPLIGSHYTEKLIVATTGSSFSLILNVVALIMIFYYQKYFAP